LWEHYGRVLDEYRFQVNLNWSRSQYYFVLNIAVLAAGLALLSAAKAPDGVAMAVFAGGALSCILAILAGNTQKTYYENTRDRKNQLEQELGLGNYAIAPTPGMGGIRGRLARVTTFQTFMLGALLAADLAGLGTAISKAFPTNKPPRVVVAVRVKTRRSSVSATVPVVASQGNRVRASAMAHPGELLALELRPGTYRLAAWTRNQCQRMVTVTSTPLQGVELRC
jgi:hypothetical protein